MRKTMSIGENRYVSLTTFTKDGRKKQCPVWIVGLKEGEVGFTTELASWKAKRILKTPSVELVASNSRGEPLDGENVVRGTANLVFGNEFQNIQKKVKKKYVIQFTLIVGFGRLSRFIRRKENKSCGVVIKVAN
jgi:PPOX class probable F420-dependent enzyme